MVRPWQIAIVFGVCLAVVLAALGWTSIQVLRLDRAQTQEESIRLALWRMESALVSLVAQESARPYFEYSAFYSPQRSYARMYNEKPVQGETLVPSPVLVQSSPYILLHFQLSPDGALTSPQAPEDRGPGGPAALAYATREEIEKGAARLARLRPLINPKTLAAALPPPEFTAPGAGAQQPQQARQEDQAQQQAAAQGQAKRNVAEYQARAQAFQQMASNTANLDGSGLNRYGAPGDVREGVTKAAWLGGELLLARRVSVGGREYIQGAWLDWPAIRGWLLASVADLVPHADLVPVGVAAATGRGLRRAGESSGYSTYGLLEEPGRLLASLPVRLVPGAAAEGDGEPSALRLSLIVAWICVLLAGAAVAALLWASVALSERRAAFVSAVTHELRTPLTTFRMYSEMLSRGMVADEAKRLRYLETLRIEADRLGHLVENVLAYARLERGRARGRIEAVALETIVERVRGRLADRAAQAGMELVVEPLAGDATAAVRADASAVEQILFNLVDNACKYAAAAADKRIHLVAEAAAGGRRLKVCDHGPGISPKDGRRLFRPFSKSARDAANSAPGVGLGLALSRRLAREMGGDLVLEPAADGACFMLILARQ